MLLPAVCSCILVLCRCISSGCLHCIVLLCYYCCARAHRYMLRMLRGYAVPALLAIAHSIVLLCYSAHATVYVLSASCTCVAMAGSHSATLRMLLVYCMRIVCFLYMCCHGRQRKKQVLAFTHWFFCLSVWSARFNPLRDRRITFNMRSGKVSRQA